MATREADVKEKGKPLNIESVEWNGLTWIDIEKPTERETEYLANNYPFHPLTSMTVSAGYNDLKSTNTGITCFWSCTFRYSTKRPG